MIGLFRFACLSVCLLVTLPASASCQDLSSVSYQKGLATPMPLLDLLERVSKDAGWLLQSTGFESWRGPLMRGDVSFASAKEAVSRLIRDASDAGWPISGIIDKTNCVIRVSYHGTVPSTKPTTDLVLRDKETKQTAKSTDLKDLERETPPAASTDLSAASTDLVLRDGERLSVALREWLQSQGWKLIWDTDRDWIVPSGVTIKVTPTQAGDITSVIDQLAYWLQYQGAPIQFYGFTNRVLKVQSTEATRRSPKGE